ncbi:hypothetical protein ANCDUO_16014 [Ancylostoma duodenale]|uniref:Uncharacterized protein n=1 Tax=Ancylostoma duodenale TaxID=51022 RepID=A0A0C2FZ12_9BILA|nr:hypothetical protein ANCDUO_16014 [Ancylostoma duodenale]
MFEEFEKQEAGRKQEKILEWSLKEQLLVESLKRYEDRLDLRTPDRKEWTFLNSFNYAYGLILTLGHGAKTPETTGGQPDERAVMDMLIRLGYPTIQ